MKTSSTTIARSVGTGSVVLGVDVVRKAFTTDAIFEGHGLIAAHRATDSDEVRSAAVGAEDLWVQRLMFFGELIGFVLGLILTVVSKGYDPPLGCGYRRRWSGYRGCGFKGGCGGRR